MGPQRRKQKLKKKRLSDSFPDPTAVTVGPHIFSVISALKVPLPSTGLVEFLGGKEQRKATTSIVKDFNRIKGMQNLGVPTRPGHSLTTSETVTQWENSESFKKSKHSPQAGLGHQRLGQGTCKLQQCGKWNKEQGEISEGSKFSKGVSSAAQVP